MTDTAGLIADLTQLRKEIIDPHIHIINEAHDANVITRAIAEITRLAAALAGGWGSDPTADWPISIAEPLGCPTPGACSCPKPVQTRENLARSVYSKGKPLGWVQIDP